MTKHLHNLKAILAAVILMALTAPAANALSRSYSIDDLTGSTWAPSESMYNALVYKTNNWIFNWIFYRDLLVEVNGAELKLGQRRNSVAELSEDDRQTVHEEWQI